MTHPKVNNSPLTNPVRLPLAAPGEHHKALLGGPPQTAVLRSGHVLLAPGKSVGLHTTGEGEEMIIPLSGQGQLSGPAMEPLVVEPGFILYNPPRIYHDVTNTGTVPLSYIYVVAALPSTGEG